ncbi:MAG: tryptophan--tRNA ligase [Patescibacteria group bacterium]|jgi:tryptophanyl-tRNA synthetase
MSKPIIVSGIQPTGNLHIGNYLGAIKNWVGLQNSGKYDMYIFIADLHALTGLQTSDERRKQILATAAELIAVGIDPKKTTFFIQSDVKEHTELSWILSNVTNVNELERMTQYKDKSERQHNNINAGLLTYPILQAADILLYKGALVPIGQDQIQHLELTNDIARWFNNRYGATFNIVKPLLTHIPKVMSLLEPTKKMSKSLGHGHVIDLCDEPEVITEKIKKAVTATEGGVGAPGVQNLLSLLKEFGDEKIHSKFVGDEKNKIIRYGDLKQALAEAISAYFADFRKKRTTLLKDDKKLKTILKKGATTAEKVAKTTIKEVRNKVGLV